MTEQPFLRICGTAAVALTLTTALTAAPALAQLATEEEGLAEDEGVLGGEEGGVLGTEKEGVGATGAGTGGGADPALLGMSTEFLREREVVGEDGEEIGEVEEVVRTTNPFGVVTIETEWTDAPDAIVVPLNELVVAPEGLILPALSEATVNQFDAYSSGAGYETVGPEVATVEDLYRGTGEEGEEAASAETEAIEEGEAEAASALGYEGMEGMIGRDPATLPLELNELRGMDVLDATGSPAGSLDNFVQSSRLYLVVAVDEGWFEEDTQIVVPLDRFAIVGEEGDLMLSGVTSETIEDFEAYTEAQGGYGFGGYQGIGEYETVGEAYGGSE